MTTQLMTDAQAEVYREGVLFGFRAAVELTRPNAKTIPYTLQYLDSAKDDPDKIIEMYHKLKGKKNEDDSDRRDNVPSRENATNTEKPAYLSKYRR